MNKITNKILSKKLNSNYYLILILSFVLVSCSNHKKNKGEQSEIIIGETGNKLEVKFTPHVKEIIKNYNLPGLTIGVVKNNQLVYAKAFGNQSVKESEAMTIQSVFHMASISKLFVATAIMQLYEQEQLHLDDPIVKHLPYFKLNDDRYQLITIQQMLSHVSGMPDTNNYEWESPRYDEKALEDYVKEISGLSLSSKPGEKYAYSNIAYEILGDVIAKVSGMSFEEYQRKNILNPLEMKSSTFLKEEGIPNNWAKPHIRLSYNKTLSVYPYNRKHAPSSTLHSNIIDMANWAKVHLNKGSINDKTILKSQSYDLLWKHWIERREELYIGLSWFISEYEGRKLLSHSGSDLGFTTNFVIVPEENLGIIILANVSDAPVSYITGDVLRILFGKSIPKRKLPAFIQVTNAYKKDGLNAAKELWKNLQENKPDQYIFDPDSFAALFYAMFLDDPQETRELCILTKALFPSEVHKVVISEARNYQKAYPNNKSVDVILEIFKEE